MYWLCALVSRQSAGVRQRSQQSVNRVDARRLAARAIVPPVDRNGAVVGVGWLDRRWRGRSHELDPVSDQYSHFPHFTLVVSARNVSF